MKTVMSPKPNSGEHDDVGGGRSPEIDTDLTNQGEAPTTDEENSYINLGYSPLAQGPEGIIANEEDDEDDELSVDSLLAAAGSNSVDDHESSFASEELKERRELWKTPRDIDQISALDEDAADKIKTLMKGFSLPSNHIPDWASQIPEDKWISELLSKIAIQSQNIDK